MPMFIPTLFKNIVIDSVRPSVRPFVCPLCYLHLNHWTKFNQIKCVSYSHEWGVQRQVFFLPRPLGRGQKVKYHLISIAKPILKKILYQTLYVLLQMKDTRHIRRDFHSVAWVTPQGWDFRALGCPGRGSFVFQSISNRRG